MEQQATDINDAFEGCFTQWNAFLSPQISEKRGIYHTSFSGRDATLCERHLQAVWFDPSWRPEVLASTNGERLLVEDPGRWNLESGPDFIDATVRVGGRVLKGDVEVHRRPADWRRHGHESDPAYANVVVHVFYYPGVLAKKFLPPGSVQICLKEALDRKPDFSFEAIDVTAYPMSAPTAWVSPCSGALSSKPPDTIRSILGLAGRERIALKRLRLMAQIEEKGENQALYEEIMTALGYKHNRHGFRILACELPYQTLRDESEDDIRSAYALLLGTAGLLPGNIRNSWSNETRAFVRDIWHRWWKSCSAIQEDRQVNFTWKLSGVRPQNHPLRRLAAAASLFCRDPSPVQMLNNLRMEAPENYVRKAASILENTSFPFWSHRLGLGGKAGKTELALLGRGRIAAILSNVIIPFAFACGYGDDKLLELLPREHSNSRIRLAAYNLLGPDHNPAIYAAGLYQQGLMQILQDYCLQREKNCAHCRFLDSLRSMEKKFTL